MNSLPPQAAKRIDSHQHCWSLSRGDYDWMAGASPALAPLRRDYLPPDLEPLLAATGVSHAVMVQAAATEAESQFMLELADSTDWVAGVVGWVDLGAFDAPGRLEMLAGHPKLVGVRPMLQDLADPTWLLHGPNPGVWEAVELRDLRFDALIKPNQLQMLRCFAVAHDHIQIVVDHAAKPPLSQGWNSFAMAKWRTDIRSLSRVPTVRCKFSGLLTEAEPREIADKTAAMRHLSPVLYWLLDCFGAERLLWGSDWPVLTLAADYRGWADICEQLFLRLSPSEQEQIWAGNARSFYGLNV